jgi:hypothetical protein
MLMPNYFLLPDIFLSQVQDSPETQKKAGDRLYRSHQYLPLYRGTPENHYGY